MDRADGKSWDSTHPCELAIRRLDWTLCLLACLERDGRRERAREWKREMWGDSRGKKMWMPPFIILQKKCNGLVSKHLFFRQELYASLKTGYVWCCTLKAAWLTFVSVHLRMSEHHENMTLTFLHSLCACWVVSDWAAAKPISDPHSYPIRLSYSTLGSGHRRSSSYWFWHGQGAGVRPQHKLTHVTELFASQHTVVFSWKSVRSTIWAQLYNIIIFFSGCKNLASERHRSKALQTGRANLPSCMDVANANRRPSCVCNSTLMITCWLAAVYLLSCSLALCCVIEFGQPERRKAWGERREGD